MIYDLCNIELEIEGHKPLLTRMALWRLDDLPYYEYDSKNNNLQCD